MNGCTSDYIPSWDSVDKLQITAYELEGLHKREFVESVKKRTPDYKKNAHSVEKISVPVRQSTDIAAAEVENMKKWADKNEMSQFYQNIGNVHTRQNY